LDINKNDTRARAEKSQGKFTITQKYTTKGNIKD